MSDIVIKPGLVSKNPLFVSKKPIEIKQTIYYKGTEDFVHVQFPIDKPWLYVLPQQFTIGGENDTGKRHQPIKIYIQPLHPSFPKTKDIETEVRVQCRTPSGQRVLKIPVYLNDVQPIKDFEGVLSIDFGTSSSCVAYVENQDGTATVKTVPFPEGWPPKMDSVGSLLYFNDHTNTSAPDYEIGVEAFKFWRGTTVSADDSEQKRDDTEGLSDDAPLSAFKYSVKRYLGTGKKTFVLNNRIKADARPAFYDYEQLCGFVIQRVIGRAEDALGRKIKGIVATYPTTFSSTQIEALKRVFGGLGFAGDALNLAYDEANAVTLDYFNQRLQNNSVLVLKAIFPPPSYVLTFDFGGGTLDITVIKVEIKEAGPTHEIATQVIGVAGARLFAGDNISLHIFKTLKATLACYLADAGPEPGSACEDVDRYRGALQALRENLDNVKKQVLTGKELDKGTEDVMNDIIPTRYDASSGGGDELPRRFFFELWDAAETIKKKFGTPDSNGVYPASVALDVPLPHVAEYVGVPLEQQDIKILAAQYEPKVDKPIREALEKAKRLIPEGEPLALTILSGNSSRLPIVKRVAKEVLRLEEEQIHFDPEGCKIAVARGAAFARRNELVPTRIKYKLGNLLKFLPWDVGTKVGGAPFECFFKRVETELPTAKPYVFEPPTETSLLHVFSRLSDKDDKPEEIGYFDFARPPSGRAMPPELVKSLKAGQGAKRPVTIGRKKTSDDPAPGKSITVWIDSDRQVFADKEGKSFALNYQIEEFPPELDPFSGVH